MSVQCEVTAKQAAHAPMSVFERYLTLWVALCMGLYVTSIMGGAALAASFSPLVLLQTGSWRIGLAIWAALALLALLARGMQGGGAEAAAQAAAGAAGRVPGRRIHESLTFGDLGMDAYAFGPQAALLAARRQRDGADPAACRRIRTLAQDSRRRLLGSAFRRSLRPLGKVL